MNYKKKINIKPTEFRFSCFERRHHLRQMQKKIKQRKELKITCQSAIQQ